MHCGKFGSKLRYDWNVNIKLLIDIWCIDSVHLGTRINLEQNTPYEIQTQCVCWESLNQDAGPCCWYFQFLDSTSAIKESAIASFPVLIFLLTSAESTTCLLIVRENWINSERFRINSSRGKILMCFWIESTVVFDYK